MPILLALTAAVAYGLADFVGGTTSARVPPWAVALCAQLGGGVVVLAASPLVTGSPDGSDLAWTLLAGLGNGAGTAFLYRGLSSGRMGVVAPVSGVGAALLPVVVGVATGERPAALVWAGVVLALPAIWLVARADGVSSAVAGPPAATQGLLDGVLAGLGFGTLFVALAQIPQKAGLVPLGLNQLVAGLTIVVIASTLGAPWLPRVPRAAVGAVSGVLGALATGLFMVASRGGHLAVVAVITSLYPAATVVLAATVLREPVHRAQLGGLGLCVVAVALVALGR